MADAQADTVNDTVNDTVSDTGPVVQQRGMRTSFDIGRPNGIEVLHGIDLELQRGDFCGPGNHDAR